MPRPKAVTILVRSLVVLLGVVVLALASVYVGYAWITSQKHDLPFEPAPPVAAAADTAEGHRLSVLLGCMKGCHGVSGHGTVIGEPGLVRIGTPNLTEVLPRYSDPELVRLLRFGVKRDGTTALIMPAGTFYPLSNADLALVIAYLRGLPPAPTADSTRIREIAFVAKLGLVLGKFPTSFSEVDRTKPRWGELPRTTSIERGRYLASVICSECHGLDLKGKEFQGSPSLAIVGGYDFEQFEHLMRTGEPIGGRDLGLMGEVAREAFVEFRPDEVSDLYAYLRANFGQPIAAHASADSAGHEAGR